MLHETNFVEYLVISRSKLRPVLDAKGIRSHEIYVEAGCSFLLEKLLQPNVEFIVRGSIPYFWPNLSFALNFYVVKYAYGIVAEIAELE